jgi:hypothetical protein
MNQYENPIITRIMRDGPEQYPAPCCPVCGQECDTFFKDRFGDIFGCDECVTRTDAAEEWESMQWQL